MYDAHFYLVESLIELQRQKNNFTNKLSKEFSLARCRIWLLESYFYSMINALISSLHAINRLRRFCKIAKKEDVDISFNNIKKAFELDFKKRLNEGFVTKIYVLFNPIRKSFEDEIFSKIKKLLDTFYTENAYQKGHNFLFKEICKEVRNLAILSSNIILGFNLHCKHMNDQIFECEIFEDLYKKAKECPVSSKEWTCFSSNICESVKYLIVPELLQGNFLEKQMVMLKGIHKNPKNICMYVDYQLCPSDFEFQKENFERYKLCKEFFRSAILINCSHIIIPDEFKKHLLILDDKYKNTELKLGEILITQGKIKRADLMMALAEQLLTPEKHIGEILKDMGKVKKIDVFKAMEVQELLIQKISLGVAND